MAISMYQASAPVLINSLRNLKNILQKAQAHAETKKIDPSVFVGARLAPDMFPLSRQVQIATDMSKSCVARLAGTEPPKWEDNEKTFEELYARIDKAIEYAKGFKAAQIDGSEERDVVLKSPRGEMKFKGQPFLAYFVLPNFFFHVTTAYNILRHNGVELGKMDFIGPPPG
jgi:uncharacterized protein